MSDPVTRLNAALEGRYRIERELGEGGMATVYLADDLKHERKVALKVLKPELAAVVGAERFLAEIKTTANLTHPHILPLHDSGEADGFLFYVMPYIADETLQDRIEREKQLPVDDAVRIATAVASALQAAHEQGIIHRDIKPANILLSRGEPLIADFGIALAAGAAGGDRLTQTGLSLGTPFYMSPEQATGDLAVGATTETYALGSVLYEMLVGDPPYAGSTAQAVLGKIIAGEPVSVIKHRPSVPANVDAAVRCALEKLPADRFKGTQEFANALTDPGFRYGETAGVAGDASVGPWKQVASVFAALFVLATSVAGWALLRPEPPLPIERFASPFGDGQGAVYSGAGAYVLSPDGSMLVYRGPSGLSGNQLWARRWDDLEPTPIRGADEGRRPSVSLDGQAVAFEQGGEIKVVSLQGGPVTTLISGTWPHWGSDGYIYATVGGSIVRVPATGGPPEPVVQPAGGEVSFYLADVLPGGTVALIRVDTGIQNEIRAVRLDTGEMNLLTFGDFARYAASGHVVYLTLDGTLMAAPLDPGELELGGQPVALVEDVLTFSISHTGKLFYTRGEAGRSEFIWVTRAGQATPVQAGWSFDPGGGNQAWRLSPDGTRLALRETVDGNEDIWIKELDDGPYVRLTRNEAVDWSPHWAPDGEMVTFASPRAGGRDLWTIRADGTGEAELLYDHESFVVEGFWGPAGEWLVLRGGSAGAGANTRDILAFRPGVDSVAQPLLAEEYDEQEPALSPDGRWLAYISNETGVFEVSVRPFPDVAAGKWTVSTDGGIMPVWAHSGRELFFMDSNRGLVAAEFDPDFDTDSSGSPIGERVTLFTLPPMYTTSTVNIVYGVAPGDQRFLMARAYQDETQESPASPFVLVNNFFEELKQRVPN